MSKLLYSRLSLLVHQNIIIQHRPCNIIDIDRNGWNIMCRWCQDSYIFPQDNITPWENRTLLAVHRNLLFHDISRSISIKYATNKRSTLKKNLQWTTFTSTKTDQWHGDGWGEARDGRHIADQMQRDRPGGAKREYGDRASWTTRQ